jgi:hypothetical protein
MTEPVHRDHGILREFLFSRPGLVLVGFLVVAGYLLWQEHAAHLQGYLPLILVLVLCGGMHLFMHSGHGSHGEDHGSVNDRLGKGDG